VIIACSWESLAQSISSLVLHCKTEIAQDYLMDNSTQRASPSLSPKANAFSIASLIASAMPQEGDNCRFDTVEKLYSLLDPFARQIIRSAN
jgi:hypothetical protein